MTENSFQEIWQQLSAAGLIVGVPQRLGGGNLDRRPELARSSWRAQRPDGTAAKLTLAPTLADYREHCAAFAAAVPDLAPTIVFGHRTLDCDIVAESYMPGHSLDTVLARPDVDSALTAQAVRQLLQQLNATDRPSDEPSRLQEWTQWTDTLLKLPCWDARALSFLTTTLLPRLQASLILGTPARRWIHGDFIGRNILIDDLGNARLIDPEFAVETHFPAADAARFYTFTPGAAKLMPLLGADLPPPDPAALLLFWLQQIEREVSSNTTDYIDRWLPARLSEVRRLAETLFGRSLAECPWPLGNPAPGEAVSSSIEYKLEDARWLIDSPDHALRLAGWCHLLDSDEPISAIEATAEGRCVASVGMQPRVDVQAHFKGKPAALETGFVLALPPIDPLARLTLVTVSAAGRRQPFWSGIAGDLPGRGPVLCHYPSWAQLLDPDPPDSAAAPSKGPTFSILLPVFNPPIAFLTACLESVRRQYYTNWELCIIDDASTAPEVAPLLARAAKEDSRIRVDRRALNGGIARATNDALQAATGDYIVLLDHDDLLRPHALAELAAALAAAPDLDAVYSDEDKIDVDGRRVRPMFKPAFSPEFLRGVMYLGHVLCARTSIAKAVGGFDPQYDGIQDYEFMLRVSEHTQRIGHIPRVLYHWRQSPASSALSGNVKGDMDRKQVEAVQAHLQRLHDPRRAESAGGHRVRLRPVAALDDRSPKVFRQSYAAGEHPLAVLSQACETSECDMIVLISDQVESVSPEATVELASLASLPDSGLVAPILVSPQHALLEAGCTRNGSRIEPIMRGFDDSGDGFNGSLRCNREVSAVSPWCLAIRRSLAHEVIGSAQTWSEFCAAVEKRGCFNRVCAGVRVTLPLRWQEYPTSGSAGPASDAADRFYNPHFASDPPDYRLSHRPHQLPRSGQPFVFQIESDFPDELADGGLSVRGWCFHLDAQPVRIRITAAKICWETTCSGARPDVAAAYPAFTYGSCGFSARLRLPSGRHPLRIEAWVDTDQLTLFERTLSVPRLVELRRCLTTPAPSLLAFQMLAGPSAPARPIQRETFPRVPRTPNGVRLTIVTPSFQHGQFLGETIRSVLEQPSVACDYLVQDGGSTDGTAEVLNQYGPRLHSWASIPDDGQADAIARAFARTNGRPEDVMAWINSDDFYLPGALAYVAAYFDGHPEIDVVYGHRVVVDERSREIGRWFLPAHNADVLRLNDFVPQETLFWRRRLWEKVGGIDPSYKFAMDWDLLLRFQAAGAKFVRVPYFLACFRVHPAQKTSAQIGSVGQNEIDALRLRAFGRAISPTELESDRRLIRYLRKSAWIEFLWRRFRIRHR